MCRTAMMREDGLGTHGVIRARTGAGFRARRSLRRSGRAPSSRARRCRAPRGRSAPASPARARRQWWCGKARPWRARGVRRGALPARRKASRSSPRIRGDARVHRSPMASCARTVSTNASSAALPSASVGNASAMCVASRARAAPSFAIEIARAICISVSSQTSAPASPLYLRQHRGALPTAHEAPGTVTTGTRARNASSVALPPDQCCVSIITSHAAQISRKCSRATCGRNSSCRSGSAPAFVRAPPAGAGRVYDPPRAPGSRTSATSRADHAPRWRRALHRCRDGS